MREQKHKYYPAYRTNKTILVAPVEISKTVATAIISKNHERWGVFAQTRSLAVQLCKNLGGAARDEHHESFYKQGYWPHVHPKDATNAHVWYAFPK